jgi:hypothetical protein
MIENMEIDDIFNARRALKNDIDNLDYEVDKEFDKDNKVFRETAKLFIRAEESIDFITNYTVVWGKFVKFLERHEVKYNKIEILKFINDVAGEITEESN